MSDINPAKPGSSAVADRSIGAIIAETRNLSADQVERVLHHQREHGVRFGEAAIALGFASADDVLFALAQQFHYPYAVAKDESRPDLVALNQPFSDKAEFFRAVRSQVIMKVFGEREPNRPRNALAVVSANQRDGKTFVAANLAITLAQLGGRTLLIDGDMRKPSAHELFGLRNGAGLSGVLAGRSSTQPIQAVPNVPGLFLLPVGPTPPNPLELLERPAFALLLRELVGKFNHVVVDTPAAELGSDALVIASRCGAALPIVRKNASQLQAFKGFVQSLADASVLLTGAVMNEHA